MQVALQWIQQRWTALKKIGHILLTEELNLVIEILIGLILLCIVVIFIKWLIRKWKTREKQVFFRKDRVLTRNELRFFKVLQQTVDEKEFCIFPMLRISELLRVKKQSSRKKYYKYFNQISRKHIDFTLCRQDNNEIVCCIELQEYTRRNKKIKAKERRDRFVKELFQETGLALVRIPSSLEEYDVEEIQKLINEAIEENQFYLKNFEKQKEEQKKVSGGKKRSSLKKHPKKAKEKKSRRNSEITKEKNNEKENQKGEDL